MHLHLPKPLHGWREFAGEVGIIVVGVLIALGAEQVVETVRHHHQAELARRAIAEELGNAAEVGYERLIIQPCLQGRIRDLQTQLSGSGGAWKASPMNVRNTQYLNVMPVVYRGPSRPLPMDSWRAATTGGTVDYMDPGRVAEFSSIYTQIALFDAAQTDEARAAARLAPLAFDRTLDANARTGMLAKLAEVDRINSIMALVGSQIIDEVRGEKLGFPPTEVESDRMTLIKSQRATRGTCVRTDLPLDLGPG
jgi:hypothetical protein